MSHALNGLKQVAQIASPRTMKSLWRAGTVTPRTPLALTSVLPWLIGRGPSLGCLVQMNTLAVGDKVAIVDRDGELTWRQLDERSNRVSNLLVEHGLVGGSVATVLRNGRAFAEVLIGAQKAGVVACPLNTWAKRKELQATLSNSGARLLVYDTAHAEQVAALDTSGLRLLHVGPDDAALARSEPYEEVLAARPARRLAPFTADKGSLAILIHTSGTTGTPKGARRDTSAAGIGTLANLLAVVPYRRNDIIYCPAPLFHSFGLLTFTLACALGATLVLPERFDPRRALKDIERHRATAASFVPVMIRRIVSLPTNELAGRDLSSLRIVLASGSALGEDLRRRARAVLGDVLYDLYGSTEAGWVAIATPEDMARHPSTVGRPVPGVEVAAFDPSGRRLGPGEPGELFIASEALFEGYTSGEERPRHGRFMSIGDVGRVDADGYVFVEGRADDMVVVGGENVYPIEVEEVLEAVPGVSEATVVGVPDDEFGQVLVAFVAGNVTEQELEAACRAELASYKVPRRFELVDALPRTATGKVLKRELVSRLSQ